MKYEFSAGGVVYKRSKVPDLDKRSGAGKGQRSKVFILVGKHSYHHGWVFPKGLIGDTDNNPSASSGQVKETKKQAAIREVKEETGIEAKIEKELKPVDYIYVWEGKKIKKTVYYYTMKATGGDINDRDDEMEEVEWIDYNDVEDRLTYPSDKEVWKEARKLIAND